MKELFWITMTAIDQLTLKQLLRYLEGRAYPNRQDYVECDLRDFERFADAVKLILENDN